MAFVRLLQELGALLRPGSGEVAAWGAAGPGAAVCVEYTFVATAADGQRCARSSPGRHCHSTRSLMTLTAIPWGFTSGLAVAAVDFCQNDSVVPS